MTILGRWNNFLYCSNAFIVQNYVFSAVESRYRQAPHSWWISLSCYPSNLKDNNIINWNNIKRANRARCKAINCRSNVVAHKTSRKTLFILFSIFIQCLREFQYFISHEVEYSIQNGFGISRKFPLAFAHTRISSGFRLLWFTTPI